MAGAPTRGRPGNEPAPDEDDSSDFADTVMSVPGGEFDLPEQTIQARPMAVDQFVRTAPPSASTVVAPSRPTPPPTRPTPRPHTVPRVSPQEHPIIDQQQAPERRTPMPVDARGPKRLQPTDIVPELRAELKLARKQFGGYEVTDPNTGKSFALNEFEVSFARMFNGRRPVAEVLEAGTRLGIPINLDSLEKFIQTLDENGLLNATPNPAPGEPNWPSRGQWETHVRTLFQSGIRLLRMGKHAEAAGYFEALLQEDPDNVEARELLGMAQSGPAAPAPYGSSQMQVPNNNATQLGMMPPQMQPMQSAQMPQQMMPSQQMPVVQLPNGQMAPVLSPHQMQQLLHLQQPLPQKSGVSTRVLIISAVAVVAIAIGAFVLLRNNDSNANHVVQNDPKTNPDPTKTDPTKVDPAKTDPVVDPSKDPTKTDPTKVDPTKTDPSKDPTKTDPTKVDPSKDPTKTDPSKDPTKTDPTKADPSKDPTKTDPTKTDPSKDPTKTDPTKTDPSKDPTKTDPTKVDPTKTDPSKDPTKTDPTKTDPSKDPTKTDPTKKDPTKTATRVEAPSGGDITSYLRSARAVKKGDKLFDIVRVTTDAAKAKELQAKVAEMEKLAKQDPGTYEPFLADARKELASARHVSTTTVKAPKSGMATPQVKQGSTVRAGQVLVEIVE